MAPSGGPSQYHVLRAWLSIEEGRPRRRGRPRRPNRTPIISMFSFSLPRRDLRRAYSPAFKDPVKSFLRSSGIWNAFEIGVPVGPTARPPDDIEGDLVAEVIDQAPDIVRRDRPWAFRQLPRRRRKQRAGLEENNSQSAPARSRACSVTAFLSSPATSSLVSVCPMQ